MKTNRFVAVVIIVFLFIFTVEAGFTQPDIDKINEYEITNESDNQPNSSFVQTLFKVFLSLIFVTVVIVITYWLLKFVRFSRLLGTIPSRHMKTIDYLPLNSNRGIYILKIINDFYAVSSSEKGIDILFKITDEVIEPELIVSEPGQLSFKQILKNMFSTKNTASYETSEKQSEDLNAFKEKLKKIKGLKPFLNHVKEDSEDEKY
jgi:flagellar biogenesis protein FliO